MNPWRNRRDFGRSICRIAFIRVLLPLLLVPAGCGWLSSEATPPREEVGAHRDDDHGLVTELLQRDPGPDVSTMKPEELEFTLPDESVDASTGFRVCGKNDTKLIRNLRSINGRSIAELETQMRPGARGKEGSHAGFLGRKESLLKVLAEDNDFVLEKSKLTHQDLARPLLYIGFYAKHNAYSEKKLIQYGKLRFQVSCQQYKGYQYSPFFDQTKTYTDVTVLNLHTGRSLEYSLLVPQMIYRYGFYEGHGTSYRVPPAEIIKLLQLGGDTDE